MVLYSLTNSITHVPWCMSASLTRGGDINDRQFILFSSGFVTQLYTLLICIVTERDYCHCYPKI